MSSIKLIITGGVGVGKTTMITNICKALNEQHIRYRLIPEFIDGDENGYTMLNSFINHKITAYEFQKYILSYFDIYLSKIDFDNTDVLVFERLPDDSITCFVNIDVKHNLITQEEFKELHNICNYINKKYKLPSYFIENNNCDIIFCKTDDINKNTKFILNEFNKAINKNRNLLVGLYNTNEECLKRVHIRNRESEVNTYNIDTIDVFNKHYLRIYEILKQNRCLEFSMLPELIY